ncbi:MAG: hypothetical protein P8N17_01165 [Luminiphilus sp.]|nr:hypothetical protein [Luminiphilus sp.]
MLLDAELERYFGTVKGQLATVGDEAAGPLKRVATYGAAMTSMMVMASQGEAAVIVNGGDAPVFGIENGVGTLSSSPGFIRFDIDGDADPEFKLFGYSSSISSSSTAYGYSGNAGIAVDSDDFSNGSRHQFFGGGSDDLPKLSAGFTLGSSIDSASWTSSTGTGNDIIFKYAVNQGWEAGADSGFIGFRLNKQNGDTHYGWIRLTTKAAGTDPYIRVMEYAYEDQPDTPIQVGEGSTQGAAPATPVPVMGAVGFGLTTLALGGLGLSALRRRRQAMKRAA